MYSELCKCTLHFIIHHISDIWAVVNNAGIAVNGFVEWTSMDLYRKHYEVNVLGLVRTTKLFLPLLRKRQDSRIVNVASVAGEIQERGGGTQ